MTEQLAAEPGITEGNKRFYRGLGGGLRWSGEWNSAQVALMPKFRGWTSAMKPVFTFAKGNRTTVDEFEWTGNSNTWPTFRQFGEPPTNRCTSSLVVSVPWRYRRIPRRSFRSSRSFISYAVETDWIHRVSRRGMAYFLRIQYTTKTNLKYRYLTS